MKNLKTKLAIAGVIATMALGSGTSFAGQWGYNHPRRVEVNSRLANQNRRITAGVRDGQLTHQEAHQLRSEDRSVLHQERQYAHFDDGHISRPEQGVLNQDENGISHQIYTDRHDGE
ncbi:MAG TPA: hypothetical protein VMA09_18085 [Candidatus Binataceae bacterium]|nr:hypothetical protein [Candidatus Binataceae bacterium]